MAPVLATGLDVLLTEDERMGRILRGKRIGLLANAASVAAGLVPAPRALLGADYDVRVLFGPEHGFWGAAQDMEAVAPGEPSRLPVVSLYGSTFEELSPRPESFEGLDVVVSDLPDVGSRYYTFVWTTALMMRACAARGIPVVPDILANAGGVTVSYFEWVQDLGRLFWNRDEIRAKLAEKLNDAFDRVWEIAGEREVTLRTAALVAGIRDVSEALTARGLYP